MSRAAARGGVVALGAACVVTFSAGTALGYYAAGIDGTTATATLASGTVVLEATAATTAGLYPGGPAADVTVTVTNPFEVPITVDAVTATATGCTTPDLTVAQAGLPLAVPANATVTQKLSGVVRMGLAASSDCEGVALDVRYTVTGRL